MNTRRWLLVLPALSLGAMAGVLILGSLRPGLESEANAQAGGAGGGGPGGTVKVGKYHYLANFVTFIKIDAASGKTYALMPPLMDRPFGRDTLELAWVPVEHFDDADKARKWFMERSERFDRRRFEKEFKEKAFPDFKEKEEFPRKDGFSKEKEEFRPRKEADFRGKEKKFLPPRKD